MGSKGRRRRGRRRVQKVQNFSGDTFSCAFSLSDASSAPFLSTPEGLHGQRPVVNLRLRLAIIL